VDMKFTPLTPPRLFQVGLGNPINMQDCGRLELEPDEQITLVTESGAEYDVARKAWGFYATPSVNGRLLRFRLRTVLMRNRLQQFFVLLVEQGKEGLFQQYADTEGLSVVAWLDNTPNLEALARWLEGEQ
jgi:hypothetical protein